MWCVHNIFDWLCPSNGIYMATEVCVNIGSHTDLLPDGSEPLPEPMLTIGIDHDTVCAGVVGTAIRNSTSCAGRRAAAPAGTTSAVPDCSTNHDSADRISGQFLFYHDHNFTKSNGNLRFQRLVPLFLPIGVCVTTHDDGTASDVTIGMWRHNQQATNHERNGKPCFSFPM